MTIRINEQVSIPEQELHFTASHSSGPGGQNVNKVSSRVTLWFDVANSPTLTPEQKGLIIRRLRNRINKDGVLRIHSQQTRSRATNRELAVERFSELMLGALRRVPARRRTRVGRAARLRRLQEKKKRSTMKKERSQKVSLED